MYMKKIIFTSIVSAILSIAGCSDNSTNPITPGSTQFSGIWHADQVQMVHAPNASGHSAQMKLQLQQLGSMPASSVGWADLSFESGNKWSSQPIGGSEDLGEITFIDALNGFIIVKSYSSQNNKYYATADGGNTWNLRTVSIFNNNWSYRFAISFIDAQNGWAIGMTNNNQTILAKTIDGGINWTQIFDFQTNDIADIWFVNSSIGFAVGYDKVYKTTNAGVNWNVQNISQPYAIKIKFINDQIGFIAGSTGLNKTNDGGTTWANNTLNFNLGSFDCKDENLLFASGRVNGTSVVQKSINGGASWTTISNVNVEDFYGKGFHFTDANTGYIVSGNVIMKTVNGGTNWSQEFCEYFTRLNDVYMTNENTGLVTADDGKIWRRTNSTEPLSWTLTGQITNSQIKGITQADNEVDIAGGSYLIDGTDVVFTMMGYSEFQSSLNEQTIGNGVFTSSGNLIITLNFANDEQWKINFKR